MLVNWSERSWSTNNNQTDIQWRCNAREKVLKEYESLDIEMTRSEKRGRVMIEEMKERELVNRLSSQITEEKKEKRNNRRNERKGQKSTLAQFQYAYTTAPVCSNQYIPA